MGLGAADRGDSHMVTVCACVCVYVSERKMQLQKEMGVIKVTLHIRGSNLQPDCKCISR